MVAPAGLEPVHREVEGLLSSPLDEGVIIKATWFNCFCKGRFLPCHTRITLTIIRTAIRSTIEAGAI